MTTHLRNIFSPEQIEALVDEITEYFYTDAWMDALAHAERPSYVSHLGPENFNLNYILYSHIECGDLAELLTDEQWKQIDATIANTLGGDIDFEFSFHSDRTLDEIYLFKKGQPILSESGEKSLDGILRGLFS